MQQLFGMFETDCSGMKSLPEANGMFGLECAKLDMPKDDGKGGSHDRIHTPDLPARRADRRAHGRRAVRALPEARDRGRHLPAPAAAANAARQPRVGYQPRAGHPVRGTRQPAAARARVPASQPGPQGVMISPLESTWVGSFRLWVAGVQDGGDAAGGDVVDVA